MDELVVTENVREEQRYRGRRRGASDSYFTVGDQLGRKSVDGGFEN